MQTARTTFVPHHVVNIAQRAVDDLSIETMEQAVREAVLACGRHHDTMMLIGGVQDQIRAAKGFANPVDVRIALWCAQDIFKHGWRDSVLNLRKPELTVIEGGMSAQA